MTDFLLCAVILMVGSGAVFLVAGLPMVAAMCVGAGGAVALGMIVRTWKARRAC